MDSLDSSQQLVLELDPTRHARVLGAPGSGKTRVLLEAFKARASRAGWADSDLLVLATNRAVATQLRRQLEGVLGRAIAGTPVRTANSLAFAVLQRAAAREGRTPPTLLTGPAHDEAIAAVVADWLEAAGGVSPHLPAEVLRTEAFRAELRELDRVLDDAAIRPAELARQLQTGGGGRVPAPDTELTRQWQFALELLGTVRARLRVARPDEVSASAALRAACEVLLGGDEVPVPRLVLVDDAQELGEGELALLAALVGRGARVWAFGDPDIATGAFHGERVRVLAGIEAELRRKGAPGLPPGASEQEVVLERVYRHGSQVRGFVRSLSDRVGTAGTGQQRAAVAAETPGTAVQFATVPTPAEQLGVVAHRLRRRRLGLDGVPPRPWSEMVVVCRSRGEVARAARVLAGHQVPTSVAAGGVILREHQLVRELIRLLQHALGSAPLRPREVLELLGGVVGGLDPIALRRLRGELRLQENRAARAAQREPASVDEIVAEGFAHPGEIPIVDSRGGRSLRRLGRLAAAGVLTRQRGGTAREVLWEVWNGTGLAPTLQQEAIEGRGSRADEAHRALDAVLGLFFALQRHEEQDSEVPINDLLTELLESTVPKDTLAARSERDVVTVTTPQGVIGREFAVVCVLGPQHGSWPNLRARGSLLGAVALERWLRGGEAVAPSRRDTLHDELRLFVHTCARARDEVLAVAIADEDHHPSVFFGLGRDFAVAEPLPSIRLTVRGAVAEMRRRLTSDPGDRVALASLVALAAAGAPGAHPAEWYGVLPPSTEAPLVDLEGDPEATVSVSPSRIEDAERCPLDWAISRLGGASTGLSQGIGTLLHHALETARGAVSAEEIVATVAAEWGGLVFEAGWESERKMALVREMARGLADYLSELEGSDRTVIAREAPMRLDVGRARLSGVADLLEARTLGDGRVEIGVVDLKTGGKMPTSSELPTHAQLQAYQLGILQSGFDLGDEQGPVDTLNGGARLLFVHPDVRTTRGADAGSSFRQVTQPLLDDEARRAFHDRVEAVARVMAAGTFTARVEHHCSDPHSPGGACRLHIIPAVSHA